MGGLVEFTRLCEQISEGFNVVGWVDWNNWWISRAAWACSSMNVACRVCFLAIRQRFASAMALSGLVMNRVIFPIYSGCLLGDNNSQGMVLQNQQTTT